MDYKVSKAEEDTDWQYSYPWTQPQHFWMWESLERGSWRWRGGDEGAGGDEGWAEEWGGPVILLKLCILVMKVVNWTQLMLKLSQTLSSSMFANWQSYIVVFLRHWQFYLINSQYNFFPLFFHLELYHLSIFFFVSFPKLFLTSKHFFLILFVTFGIFS